VRDDGLAEKDLRRHLRNDYGERPRPPPQGAGDDYQLRTALDYLKAADLFRGGEQATVPRPSPGP
jgi:carboxyl-terminal processing protease